MQMISVQHKNNLFIISIINKFIELLIILFTFVLVKNIKKINCWHFNAYLSILTF
jgi:hypothetical protein